MDSSEEDEDISFCIDLAKQRNALEVMQEEVSLLLHEVERIGRRLLYQEEVLHEVQGWKGSLKPQGTHVLLNTTLVPVYKAIADLLTNRLNCLHSLND